MGLHGQANNNGRRQRSLSNRRHRMKPSRAVKKMGKGKVGKLVGEIANPELVTEAVLKKRRKNARTNVTLSGKKKRKIMKQIKHMQAANSRMEVEANQASSTEPRNIEMSEVKHKKSKKSESRSLKMDTDVEMKE